MLRISLGAPTGLLAPTLCGDSTSVLDPQRMTLSTPRLGHHA